MRPSDGSSACPDTGKRVRVATRQMLVVVSAPSGAGKTSLCEWAVTAVPNLVHSVSHTTRPPRPHEVNGRDYHFITPTEFQERIDRRDFAEWAEIYGCRYGTSRSLLEKIRGEGRGREGNGRDGSKQRRFADGHVCFLPSFRFDERGVVKAPPFAQARWPLRGGFRRIAYRG